AALAHPVDLRVGLLLPALHAAAGAGCAAAAVLALRQHLDPDRVLALPARGGRGSIEGGGPAVPASPGHAADRPAVADGGGAVGEPRRDLVAVQALLRGDVLPDREVAPADRGGCVFAAGKGPECPFLIEAIALGRPRPV